jgi:protein-tyrosine phosphatase
MSDVTRGGPADDALPEWHVEVDGCKNFRDAGGWTTLDGARMRRGRLYRSDDPVRVTETGRQTVAGLGLAAVVDLRQESQFMRSPGFLPPERTVHLPLVDRVIDTENPPRLESPEDIVDLYVGMLERSEEQLGRVLDAIATHLESGPVLVHCAYGKDRAGLVTAIVQAAIGVPAESIVADYHRSHEPSRRRRAWQIAEPLPDDPNTKLVPPFLFEAPATVMGTLLERVTEEHGSLATWVASFPSAPDTIDRLRHELLES